MTRVSNGKTGEQYSGIPVHNRILHTNLYLYRELVYTGMLVFCTCKNGTIGTPRSLRPPPLIHQLRDRETMKNFEHTNINIGKTKYPKNKFRILFLL